MTVQPYGRRRWRWLLVAGAPLLAAIWFALSPRHVDLWVDNGRAVPVEVRVGDSSHVLEPGSTLHLRVRAGHHALAGPDGILQAELAANPTGPRAHYVWNVDGQSRYWIVGKGYGTSDPEPQRLRPPAALFAVPEQVIPGLNLALPETVRVKRETPWAVRHVLWSEHHAAQQSPAKHDLIVDNTGILDLEIRVDDTYVCKVAPENTWVIENLPTGTHTFTAIERSRKGAAGRRFEQTVELRPAALETETWVWAPGNAKPEYALVAQSYGTVDEVPPTELYRAPSSWFALPDGVFSVNVFPQEVAPQPGQAGAVVRSLWTRRAFEEYQRSGELRSFAEGIQLYQMGELGEKLMAEQAEQARRAHEDLKAAEQLEPQPGDLDPEKLFPPR